MVPSYLLQQMGTIVVVASCKNRANQYGTVFAGENTWHEYCICKNDTKLLAWYLLVQE